MKINNKITLQRLVGKIDNDFNISESDWIPRVAAWTIDALSQMQCLPMERKRRTLEVSERIAQFPCEINGTDIKVFDKHGNEIMPLSYIRDKGCLKAPRRKEENSSTSIAIFDPTNTTGVNYMHVAEVVNDNKRYYILNCNNIELSFDTDYIDVETFEVATYHDDYYDCDCPFIYDNGLLLEALSWYCLFKYLSRGSSHPVYSLKSNNPTLNPFLQWNNLRVKAATNVKIAISKDDKGWNNFLYNSTFLPRSR